MEKALVDETFLLEKYPGKGGWTYAVIPQVLQDKKAPFGWVKVKGSIDGYELKSYKLMPMGEGKLFLPVKAEIRKKIGKKAGDEVHIVLFHDNEPIAIPEELILCLQENAKEHMTFLSYSEGEQKAFIDWIYSAKTEETKVDRIAKTIDKLSSEKKFDDK